MSELLVTPSQLVPFITDSVFPLLFALIIIGVGYWTWIEQRPESAMVRLAAWCVVLADREADIRAIIDRELADVTDITRQVIEGELSTF
mgnify:FL=1